jgi:hypothetical protein
MRGLTIAIALLVASPAAAQTAAPDERAQAFIQEQGVGDLFAPVEGEAFMVRHTASGLTCRFTGDEQRRTLTIFGGLPRGEDVGCLAEQPGRYTTLYATRYSPAITVQQALADGVGGIRGRWPDARPLQPMLTMTQEEFPYLMQHFLVTLNGQQHITTVMVAEQNGWIFKLRYTEAAPDEDALRRSQLEAGAMLLVTLMKEREAPGTIPPPPTPQGSPT